MEMVKKQADVIGELEGELSKARKQERAYEEAMEQLQADLDSLEQENTKMKQQVANAPERQVVGTQPNDGEAPAVDGNFETSHLLEQIEALRGAVRFLRSENSYLKGQDLLKELYALPKLPDLVPLTFSTLPTPSVPSSLSPPPLDPSSNLSGSESESEPDSNLEDPHSDADPDSDSDSEPPRPTLRSLATETKLLYRDVITFSSSLRVVDLSAMSERRAWIPARKTPEHQLWERKIEGERLQKRVRGLVDRAVGHGGSVLGSGAGRRLGR